MNAWSETASRAPRGPGTLSLPASRPSFRPASRRSSGPCSGGAR
jgi:hypothetical protein